jgi:signal transduction histidine kinase/CheY-like chemotaxis protein
VGLRVGDVLPEELAIRTLKEIAAALRTREVRVFEYELPGEHRGQWFEARLIAVGPDEVIALVRDMSDRRHMEAQLGIADRLAALGTLAAGVAHEVNNPLTYVLIGVDAVAKELRALGKERPLDDRFTTVLKRLDDAREGARRVRRIVGDLRSFTRAEREHLESIDVIDAIDAVLSMADSHVRYRATVVKEYGPMPRVRADSDRLKQVFLNLLLNALQSLPDNAKNVITISTGQDPLGQAQISIRDTGVGIDEESIEQIFDPFFTTKGVGVGTGLGLWICHNIITRYGGEIEVSSKPGVGTTFTIVLPAAPPDKSRARKISSGEYSVGLPADARVLVIDNEPQVGEALRILLSEFSVEIVGDGQEAVDKICGDAPYDLILCDLMMPRLLGMDVFEQVRERSPGRERPFIFMTSGAFTQRARVFLASVDNPCVTKPFREPPMRAAIRDRARLLTEST